MSTDTITAPETDVTEVEELATAPTTLADLIRIGSQGTRHSIGWGNGEGSACALTSAYIGAKRSGLL